MPWPLTCGVGVDMADDYAGDAGRDQGGNAGRGFLFMVAAGLEGDDGGCAAGVLGAGGEGVGLGMGLAELLVIAPADHLAGFGDDAADHRIGLDAAPAEGRQGDRLAHQLDLMVCRLRVHLASPRE